MELEMNDSTPAAPDVMYMLGRIDAKLDGVVATNKDHGQRISALEKVRYQLMGAASVISILASYLFHKFNP